MATAWRRSGLAGSAFLFSILTVFGVPGALGAETFRVVNVGPGDRLNIRVGPSAQFPAAGSVAHDASGIRKLGLCVRNWCNVRFQGLSGWANDRFLEAVNETSPTAPAAPDAPGFTTSIVSHRVLPDGTLAILLSDGSVRHRQPNGNLLIQHPNGLSTSTQMLTVQIAEPPPLPEGYTVWGDRLGTSLLGILGNILTPEELAAYRQTESGKTYYQLVDWRILSIQFLTQPNS